MTQTRPPQILVLLALLLLDCAAACAGSAGQEDQKTAYDYCLSGNACYHDGQYDQAIAAFRESIRLDPDCYYAHINLGVTLARSQKFTEAIEAFTLCVNKKVGSQTDRCVFYLNRAIASEQVHDTKSAQKDRATVSKLDFVRADELADSNDYVFMDANYCQKRNEAEMDQLLGKNMVSLFEGRIIVSKVGNSGKNAQEYEALGAIEGTLEEAAAVLTDFQSYPQFMPNVKEIKIAGSTQDATIVDYKLLLPLGVVKKYRLKFWSKKEEQSFQLFWKKLPWPGLKPEETITDTYGQWLLIGASQKESPVLAYYRVYTDPGNIPFGMGWIVDALTQNSIPKIIESTASRVKGRAKN